MRHGKCRDLCSGLNLIWSEEPSSRKRINGSELHVSSLNHCLYYTS
jgi:hypothetical protein